MGHTLLIAGAILFCIAGLVAALIFVTRRQRRVRKQQLRAEFDTLLARHDLQATQVQEFEHRFIALDSSLGVVAYLQDDITRPTAVIHLSEVGEIRLWRETHQSGITETARGARPDEQLSSIGIAFSLRNGTREYLPLYSEILDGIGERGALQKAAEEWIRRLQAVTTGSIKVHAM